MNIRNEHLDNTVVLYHDQCTDGFTAAHAAWLVLQDNGQYIPVRHGNPYPKEAVTGKHVVIVDFSYPAEILKEIEAQAQSLTVLDHHISAASAVQSIGRGVFDNASSGATLAWTYFHPGKPLPSLYALVRGGDIFDFSLPQAKEMLAYIYSIDHTFEKWTALQAELETEDGRKRIAEIGGHYRTYWDSIIEDVANEDAELVNFEGCAVYAINASRALRSDLGHYLAKKKGPFSLVYRAQGNKYNFNIRGDGSVDVSKIAQKYGGGGHHDAAGFEVSRNGPLPFTVL